MRFKILCGTVVFIQLFFGCTHIPKVPPMASCTFTIPAPNNYECFLRKDGTGRKINLSINLITKYSNNRDIGPRMVTQSDEKVSFDVTTQTFPITIVGEIPSSKYPWECEIIIEGTECSTCASGYSSENGGCFANPLNTNPVTYQAAKPRWQIVKSGDRYSAAITLSPAERITNVPNSCNCSTP